MLWGAWLGQVRLAINTLLVKMGWGLGGWLVGWDRRGEICLAGLGSEKHGVVPSL